MLPIASLTVGSASAKPHPAATPQILVRCSPNPVVETGRSFVQTICQVEANSTFAGKTVTISSTQLSSHCVGLGLLVFGIFGTFSLGSIALTLDNDGNATTGVVGGGCAPGSALIDASLDAPPFSTAIAKVVIESPQVTPPGLRAFPNPEVEVGDNPAPNVGLPLHNLESEVDTLFYVETNPVFAEQGVTITSDQLTVRCGLGFTWSNVAAKTVSIGPPPTTGVVLQGSLDNDGNSVFLFRGASCAAGKSTVISEVLAGGPTYSTQFNILPPAVTI